LQASPPAMPRRPAGVVVAEHRQHFGMVEGIAPAADDREQLFVRVEPFQHGVNLVDDLLLTLGPARCLLIDGAGGFLPGVLLGGLPMPE
jgi:hypothetical protein